MSRDLFKGCQCGRQATKLSAGERQPTHSHAALLQEEGSVSSPVKGNQLQWTNVKVFRDGIRNLRALGNTVGPHNDPAVSGPSHVLSVGEARPDPMQGTGTDGARLGNGGREFFPVLPGLCLQRGVLQCPSREADTGLWDSQLWAESGG